MGFRTVVVLNNDLAHEWENDTDLGRKIWLSAASCGRERFHYGGIVEQVHADCQTLAVLDGYEGKPIAHTHWYREQSDEVRNLALLKALAEQLGYRVSKKPTKEPK
jgi:hypothetical protein